MVFFWTGDILHNYALVGFLLLPLRRLSLRTLERTFIIFLIVMLIGTFVITVALERAPPDPVRNAKRLEQQKANAQAEYKLYTEGTYFEQLKFRTKMSGGPGNIVPLAVELLSLFVMGLYAGKRGVFHDVEANRPFIKKCMWVGLVCGIAGTAMFLPRWQPEPSYRFARTILFQGVSHYFFLFYAAGLVLLVHGKNPRWRERLKFFAPVGRMALTNYLMQTVIATTIFYNYGLGYYGKMGSAVGLVLCIAIFVMQAWLSAWWLRRYQFGPAEWLWRSLTYCKMQPMRALPESPSPAGALA
jgi:uncharacterized protein